MLIGNKSTIPAISNLPGQKGSTPAPGFVNTKSLYFEGPDERVFTGVSTGTNDASICYWMNTTEIYANTESQCPYGGRGPGGDFYTFGRLGSTAGAPDDTKVRIWNTFGTTKLNDGNWHFVLFTYNHTTKEVKAYVDGSITPEATFTFPAFAGGNFTLAQGYNSSNYYYTGYVDEPAHFDYILTGADNNLLYNGGIPENLNDPLIVAVSPVNWYRNGDGDTYPTLIDHGTGLNNGTMQNMVAGDIVPNVP